jgi:hypothetical protein
MVGYLLVNRSATWAMIVCPLNSITATGSHAFTRKSNFVNPRPQSLERGNTLSIVYHT